MFVIKKISRGTRATEDKLREAATTLIEHVMERHGLSSIEELTCPDMRALAAALQEKASPLSAFQKPYRIVHTEVRYDQG